MVDSNNSELDVGNMVECKSCKSKVAQYARTCPYCGQKNPTINMGVAVLMIMGFTVFVAWLLVG